MCWIQPKHMALLQHLTSAGRHRYAWALLRCSGVVPAPCAVAATINISMCVLGVCFARGVEAREFRVWLLRSISAHLRARTEPSSCSLPSHLHTLMLVLTS